MGKKNESDRKPVSTTSSRLPEKKKLFSPGYPITDLNLSMITSLYGARKHPRLHTMEFHTGIDIDTKLGEPVLSVAEGVIIFSGKQGGYGNVIIVEHSERFCTVYAHLSLMLVKKGEIVRRGEAIGKVGVTGNSTGSHLHFEVRVGGKTVNPLDFLNIVK
ncbi:MAG: M23 family metallopeptidase [Bacteroidales bacterium]|nr:M23 family metallopeptidase [Candidatus Latescibacterota bacterium]